PGSSGPSTVRSTAAPFWRRPRGTAAIGAVVSSRPTSRSCTPASMPTATAGCARGSSAGCGSCGSTPPAASTTCRTRGSWPGCGRRRSTSTGRCWPTWRSRIPTRSARSWPPPGRRSLPNAGLGVRDARVRRIRRLLVQRSARRSEGAFVVEGVNVLDAALDGDADLEALFAAPEAEAECPALLERAARRGIPVHRLDAGVLERVAGTVTPQPVLAVARRTPPSLTDVVGGPGAAGTAEAKLLVVGVDVRDPGNGGTLIRSAEAAGAHGVVFCRGSVDVTNPKTVRATAGALFHVPVVEGCDPQEVLGVLGDLGLKRIAAVAHGGERPDRVDFGGPLALVFGNEASGLPADVAAGVDSAVTIPMPGRAESLNLGMAASI